MSQFYLLLKRPLPLSISGRLERGWDLADLGLILRCRSHGALDAEGLRYSEFCSNGSHEYGSWARERMTRTHCGAIDELR
jgi:hypothetical protein